MRSLTAKTLTDAQPLRRNLEEIRRQGYALVREETQLGIAAVAAPVRSRRRQVVATISVVVPNDFADADKLVQGLLAAAKAISAAL